MIFCGILLNNGFQIQTQIKRSYMMSLRTDQYKVVINHEEQYSILPTTQSLPRGWKEVGKVGTSKDCLKYIEEVWTDMRPSDRERILRSIKG